MDDFLKEIKEHHDKITFRTIKMDGKIILKWIFSA